MVAGGFQPQEKKSAADKMRDGFLGGRLLTARDYV
jgi:hypothetical protein